MKTKMMRLVRDGHYDVDAHCFTGFAPRTQGDTSTVGGKIFAFSDLETNSTDWGNRLQNKPSWVCRIVPA